MAKDASSPTDGTSTDAATAQADTAQATPAPQAPAYDPNYAAKAMAEAEAEAKRRRIDETVPGGRYKNADGTLTDANGKPIEQSS